MTLQLWMAFLAINLMTSLAPGPSTMAAMNAGLSHGPRAAWCLLGLQLALLVQLLVVALGAGALLLASEMAFEVLRWGGAAYLIWLGGNQLFRGLFSEQDGGALPEDRRADGLLWHGMLVNFSNPKAILFMAALVPQFIDGRQPLWPQYAVIAVTMCGVDTLIMGAYAALAARLRPWLEIPRLVRWRNMAFGSLFVIFGVVLLGVKRAD